MRSKLRLLTIMESSCAFVRCSCPESVITLYLLFWLIAFIDEEHVFYLAPIPHKKYVSTMFVQGFRRMSFSCVHHDSQRKLQVTTWLWLNVHLRGACCLLSTNSTLRNFIATSLRKDFVESASPMSLMILIGSTNNKEPKILWPNG